MANSKVNQKIVNQRMVDQLIRTCTLLRVQADKLGVSSKNYRFVVEGKRIPDLLQEICGQLMFIKYLVDME